MGAELVRSSIYRYIDDDNYVSTSGRYYLKVSKPNNRERIGKNQVVVSADHMIRPVVFEIQ